MSSEVLGGGVMVAVAAALWVTYLMPTWSRRRQYLTTERNAVRLQQTLRILAETSEVPEQVHLEANARTVVTQRKLLAQAEDEARQEAKAAVDAQVAARRAAVVARSVAARAADRAQRPAAPAAKRRRLRRMRALTSFLLLAGTTAGVTGLVEVTAGGSWTLLGSGALGSALALSALSRLARTTRRAGLAGQPRVETVARGAASVTGSAFVPVEFDEAPVAQPTWTPQPLPRPLHLSRGSIAQAAMASADAAAQLRTAAAEAEVARRAAELAVAVTPLTRPAVGRPAAAAPAAANRFASMGVVGETAPGMTDLDAVLRRRRAVG